LETKKLSEREKYNLGVALEKAISELSAADPKIVCINSGVVYNREQDSYLLPYLNRKYFVNHSTGEVKSLLNGEGVSIHLQILFLHYLINASGTPLKGDWITFKELPGGQIYVEPYQNRTIKPFLKYFGNKPGQFEKIALSLEGKPAPIGDLCMVLRPFPRVPIAYVLWDGDEEFPPSANILFDASASAYLPTEDYALLPGLIIWEMAALLS
jgi:hypothetical protein